MNIRAVLLLLVPVALAAQAPTAANFRRFPSAALAKRIPVVSPKARAKAFVRPGDDLVPQIANGELDGGHIFFTIFRIMNITDFPADVLISYFDANGDPLSLPGLLDDGVSVGDFVGIADTIPGRAIRFGDTWPFDEPVQMGYAIVESDPLDSIAVIATYNNLVPGSRLFQASVPQTTRLHDRLFVPFDNVDDVRSSLALVSLTAQQVDIRARDFNGDVLCEQARFFNAGEHLPFLTQDFLPCTAGLEGILEVFGSDTTLGGVGFTADDQGQGAFVTLPVFGDFPPE